MELRSRTYDQKLSDAAVAMGNCSPFLAGNLLSSYRHHAFACPQHVFPLQAREQIRGPGDQPIPPI